MIDKGRAGYIERCTSGSWRGFDRDRPRKRIWRGRAYLMRYKVVWVNSAQTTFLRCRKKKKNSKFKLKATARRGTICFKKSEFKSIERGMLL